MKKIVFLIVSFLAVTFSSYAIPPIPWETIRGDLTSGEICTFCCTTEIDQVRGGFVYSIEGKDSDNLYIEEAAYPLQAGQPYIAFATANQLEALLGEEEGDVSAHNGLIGTYSDISVDKNVYVIFDNKLVPARPGSTVKAYRAYIDLSQVPDVVGEQSIPISKISEDPDYLHVFSDSECKKSAITQILNQTINAGIYRTFKKNGTDHTICLPFSLTSEQLSNSCLKGYSKLQKFNSATIDDENEDCQVLHLTMEDASSIEAGQPYVIAWTSGDDLVNPQFYGVSVTVEEPAYVQSGRFSFCGTFWPFAVESKDKTVMFMNPTGEPDWPNADGKINGFRAFFYIGDTPPSLGTGPETAPDTLPIIEIAKVRDAN